MDSKAHLEFSIKALVLSIILIVILTASNAYLGLKLGTTISASIPAAVIAMGLFRLFRRSSIYEINIVQTAAATGEGLTAGIAFTLPALVIMHFWAGFNYWETVIICAVGGVMGVLFSIPLRRALLKDKALPFPEGTAIGQVIKASKSSESDIKPIIYGGIVGATIALCQSGFRVLAESYSYWVIKGKVLFGYSLGFSPAVIAAGYICGITVGMGLLVGVVLGWLLGIPLLSHYYGFSHHLLPGAISGRIWSSYIRYIGVGTMLVGGMWTLLKLIKPVAQAVHSSIKALRLIKNGEGHTIHHTERDIPINLVAWGGACIAVALLASLFGYVSPSVLGISFHLYVFVVIVSTLFFFFAGFILSAISGYFAGLVGVTNSPASGLLVSALLALALLLFFIIGSEVHFATHTIQSVAGASLAVMVCAFIGSSIALTNESVQVAKVGKILKSTPWVQQVTLIGGTLVAALVLPLVLQLLFNAYGIGGVFPRPGMDSAQMLSAPQAGLMAAIAQGVFAGHIPWMMIGIGAGLAVVCIFIDEILKGKFNKRLLVLAVGLGIYLPLSVSVPTILGGIISYLVHRKLHDPLVPTTPEELAEKKELHHAMFLACGLVAGSTLMGVLLAIPFAIFKSTEVLHLVPASFTGISVVLSLVVTIAICTWLYRTATK